MASAAAIVMCDVEEQRHLNTGCVSDDWIPNRFKTFLINPSGAVSRLLSSPVVLVSPCCHSSLSQPHPKSSALSPCPLLNQYTFLPTQVEYFDQREGTDTATPKQPPGPPSHPKPTML